MQGYYHPHFLREFPWEALKITRTSLKRSGPRKAASRVNEPDFYNSFPRLPDMTVDEKTRVTVPTTTEIFVPSAAAASGHSHMASGDNRTRSFVTNNNNDDDDMTYMDFVGVDHRMVGQTQNALDDPKNNELSKTGAKQPTEFSIEVPTPEMLGRLSPWMFASTMNH